ncbi:MAG: GPR endopeptidase [Clostridia bacterium]|nr:GPR endopeptidase [Clostridia bacterium]
MSELFGRKTDLALEAHEINGEKGTDDGIILNEKDVNGITVTSAEIINGKGEELTGKKAGKYITVDIGRVWQKERDHLYNAAAVISGVIKELLPDTKNGKDDLYLVVGLGNEKITVDSIGPGVVSKLIVTRHLKELDPALYNGTGFGCVAAIAADVLGNTGIESAEQIKSIVEAISPSCVIVIDSLASRKLERLAATVQLSDTGIAPGSGVANHRVEISADTLGTPVIAIGIPTVVDSATLVCDLLDACEENEMQIKKAFAESGKSFFVSLKESDVMIRSSVKLLSLSINMALHKDLDISELEEYSDM